MCFCFMNCYLSLPPQELVTYGALLLLILWYSRYSFAFATTPQPISQPFTHHLSKWQYYNLQSHHLPPQHMAFLTLIPSQIQGHSSSGTTILLQLHSSLAEEAAIQEFLLYFQAYMCLKTCLLLSEGHAPGPPGSCVVETAVPQISLREGRNPFFSLQRWLLHSAQPLVPQTNPVEAWIAGSLQLVWFRTTVSCFLGG